MKVRKLIFEQVVNPKRLKLFSVAFHRTRTDLLGDIRLHNLTPSDALLVHSSNRVLHVFDMRDIGSLLDLNRLDKLGY